MIGHNISALQTDQACSDATPGSPLAHHFKCVWLFLLVYKYPEEKEPGFCSRLGSKTESFSPGGNISELVSFAEEEKG